MLVAEYIDRAIRTYDRITTLRSKFESEQAHISIFRIYHFVLDHIKTFLVSLIGYFMNKYQYWEIKIKEIMDLVYSKALQKWDNPLHNLSNQDTIDLKFLQEWADDVINTVNCLALWRENWFQKHKSQWWKINTYQV